MQNISFDRNFTIVGEDDTELEVNINMTFSTNADKDSDASYSFGCVNPGNMLDCTENIISQIIAGQQDEDEEDDEDEADDTEGEE
jgi:hypothetical protein